MRRSLRVSSFPPDSFSLQHASAGDRMPFSPDRRALIKGSRLNTWIRSACASPVVATRLLLLVMTIGASSVRAETVTLVGIDGQPGSPGSGVEAGAPGATGGEAVVVVGPVDPSNRGTATGGLGGAGGSGGELGGNGGAGGVGGSGLATGTSNQISGDAFVSSTATGGGGGAGGSADSTLGAIGGPGGVGGFGSATAEASNAGGSSTAVATGRGGYGGSASGPNATAGNGGGASASASTNASVGVRRSLSNARAEVIGGDGGAGLMGANGGDGASVTSSDLSATAIQSDPNGVIEIRRTLRGGRGGPSQDATGGDGGNADAVASSVGASAASLQFGVVSVGGDGWNGADIGIAGAGGTASSSAMASFSGGDAAVDAHATGGRGGGLTAGLGDGSDGAAANADATSVASTPGATASAFASATGGDGGDASGVGRRAGNGASGLATASATAERSGLSGGEGDANVLVEGGRGGFGYDGADGGDGGDAIADNLATASGRNIRLAQLATGGDAGGALLSGSVAGVAGTGGDAVSLLTQLPVDGDVIFNSRAMGGASRNGAAAGNARASGEAVAAGDVNLTVAAQAGRGSRASVAVDQVADGAIATLGTVRGESTGGGNVRVTAFLESGSGGGDATRLGKGGDAVAIDAIDGETSGSLSLRQVVAAGSASNFSSLSASTILGGEGGTAVSELNHSKTAEEFIVEVETSGGRSYGRSAPGQAFAGGDAISTTNVRNDGGRLEVRYGADAGSAADAFLTGSTAGTGGSATATIRATTAGDGNAILIAPASPIPAVMGGGAGRAGTFSTATNGGLGGTGTSDVMGIAEGDSQVRVEANASGGLGGQGATGGNGGLGDAIAVGRNAGLSSVRVEAVAFGGNGGRSTLFGRLPSVGGTGRATASGVSTGGGDVVSTATATGGRLQPGSFPGAAIASATSYAGPDPSLALRPVANGAVASSSASARGRSGSAEATARSTSGEVGVSVFRTRATARSSVSTFAQTNARAGRGVFAGPISSSLDASAFVGGTSTVEGQWGLAGFGFNSSQLGSDTVIRLETGFENDEVRANPLAGVSVSFLDFVISAENFDTIRFRIENENDLLLDQSFSSLDAAITFFSTVIDVGALAEAFDTQTIDLQFSVDAEAVGFGSQFQTVFMVEQFVVPEPGTALMLLAGLAMLSARRKGPARDRAQ